MPTSPPPANPPRAARALAPWPRALLLLGALVLASRWATLPNAVETIDGWLFVRGVERYSVAELRPHWPGYPVYIGAGKLLRPLAGDAARALHLLSLLAATASSLLLAALARSWSAAGGAPDADARRAGLAAGALFAATPLGWLTGIEILSDAFGLALALLLLLCAQRALASERGAWWLVAAGGVAGALLGARLAYLPLLLPGVYAAWVLRGRSIRVAGRSASVGLLALAAVLGAVLLWTAAQLALDGPRLVAAAAARLHEHFGAWWMRTLADGRWWRRPVELTATFAVYGLGLWTPNAPSARLLATLAFPPLLALGIRALLRQPGRRAAHLAGLFAGGQALGVVLAHDPALDRHALPLVAAACLAAGMGLPRGRRGWIALALVLASLLAVSAPLARARSLPPPADLLARWIAGRVDADRATVLVTSDVPYVAVFLEERAPRVQVESVPAAGLDEAARRLAAAGREAWSTAPSPLFPGEWAPVACFERAPWLESRGPDALWLYRRGSWGDADPGPCYGPQRPLP